MSERGVTRLEQVELCFGEILEIHQGRMRPLHRPQ